MMGICKRHQILVGNRWECQVIFAQSSCFHWEIRWFLEFLTSPTRLNQTGQPMEAPLWKFNSSLLNMAHLVRWFTYQRWWFSSSLCERLPEGSCGLVMSLSTRLEWWSVECPSLWIRETLNDEQNSCDFLHVQIYTVKMCTNNSDFIIYDYIILYNII